MHNALNINSRSKYCTELFVFTTPEGRKNMFFALHETAKMEFWHNQKSLDLKRESVSARFNIGVYYGAIEKKTFLSRGDPFSFRVWNSFWWSENDFLTVFLGPQWYWVSQNYNVICLIWQADFVVKRLYVALNVRYLFAMSTLQYVFYTYTYVY